MSKAGSEEELPPIVVDRRPASRKRVLWPGKVIWGKDLFSIDCTIRDVTPIGARISIAKDQVLPTRLQLTDLRNKMVHDAEVIWIRRPLYGLRFVGTPRFPTTP